MVYKSWLYDAMHKVFKTHNIKKAWPQIKACLIPRNLS